MFHLTIALLAVSVAFVAGANHHHGQEYQTASPGEVQGELDHLTSHFGSHLCIDLLMLDCRNHLAHPDEQLCGSDGRTYANHCYFVHASCMFAHLSVSGHGPCVVTTAMPTAGSTMMPAASTTMLPAAGSTMMPAAGSTMMPAVSTTAMTTKFTMQLTTVKSSSQVIQSVFCQNKDSINCDLAIAFVCGSDGHLYPNRCELSKAACDHPSITEVAISMCP
ncbi:agrin-like [Mizuhopecten yessoensis]|uniref:agrin-like n=1 Tax=Mizuhopecten yessoensis TaxID=6573 RepID=UPI000B45B618|nr:agrin-like [Mizuhopecten yessoensis]